MGVELCGQKLTWDDVRPFKLQFRIFRGRQRSGRIAPQDLVAYSIKMQEAKRRLGMVRDVVNTGRAQFVASRSSYPECGSSMTRRTRGGKASFLARSFASDERGAPARTLNSEIAQRDMEIAAAKMQALARGRALRRNPPLPLRRSNSRGVRVAPTAEDTAERAGEGPSTSPSTSSTSSSGPNGPAPVANVRGEGAEETTLTNGTGSHNG